VTPVQRYTPDKVLALICEKLEAVSLEIRRHFHDYELTELEVTNPANLERGSMSVNRDGFVTWEHTATISDDKDIREIVAVMTVLLVATAPADTENREE
jgi:hypothetical protein